MNLDPYKGYQASVGFSDKDGVYFGKIFGIDDLISFEGDTLGQLQIAFQDAVDDYVAICVEVGKTPDIPQWQKDLIDQRLANIEARPENLKPISELVDLLDKDDEILN